MPNLFKHFLRPQVEKFQFPQVDEIVVEPEPPPEPEPAWAWRRRKEGSLRKLRHALQTQRQRATSLVGSFSGISCRVPSAIDSIESSYFFFLYRYVVFAGGIFSR